MKIKHWQGYGIVNAVKVKDKNCTLHVRVSGQHEWGIRRDDMYDLFGWLVQRFDKSLKDKTYADFHRMDPNVFIQEWNITGNPDDYCDYYFMYRKEN